MCALCAPPLNLSLRGRGERVAASSLREGKDCLSNHRRADGVARWWCMSPLRLAMLGAFPLLRSKGGRWLGVLME